MSPNWPTLRVLLCTYLERMRFFNDLVSFFGAANLPFPFRTLDRHQQVQPCRRGDWVEHSRNQVTDLLDHTLLQDLPRYEGRPTDKVYRH